MEFKTKEAIKGIIVPLVTPLLDNETLDVEGLERLIEHTISGGVHSIFILGSTGEFASLNYKLRYEVIEQTCKFVRGRKPVLVGITDTVFSESRNLAIKAADCGVDAVVLSPPYYYSASQSELLEYLKHIMVQMPLPLFLYNIPSHTKVGYEPATLMEAAEIPGIIGIKDSSGDLPYLNTICHLLKDKPDFRFLVGREEMTASFVMMGGHGAVNGGANLFPHLLVNLYDAAVSRDFKKLIPLQEKVMQLTTTIYKVGSYGSGYLRGMKCALSIMGICSDIMAQPFQKFEESDRMIMKKLLEDFDYKSI